MNKFTQTECKKYLDKLGSFRENETKHTHHCKQGKDNDRLYITKRGSTYLFYCHHCGKRGFYRDTGPSNITHVKARFSKFRGSQPHVRRIENSTARISLPADSLTWHERARWSVKARYQIGKYALKLLEVTRYGISYSPSKGRLYFPVYHNREMIGYTARRIDCDGPKWLSLYKDKSKFFVYFNRGTDTCVIVEDYISGILCARHLSTYVLLGTHISDHGINKIKHHKNFIIFLDDDNPQVKMNQLKLRKQLQLFGDVRIVHRGTDPKNLSEEELCKELTKLLED